MFWYIILGMLIWQIVVTIVAAITHEDEIKVLFVAAGLPFLLVLGILKIVRFIHKMYVRQVYRAYLIVHLKDNGEKFTHGSAVRLKPAWLKEYNTSSEDGKYFLSPVTGKYIENAKNIRKVRKNGYFCQQWVNENVKRTA